MHPILLTIGLYSVRAYSVILFLAITAGVLVLLRQRRPANLSTVISEPRPDRFRKTCQVCCLAETLTADSLLRFCTGAIVFGLVGGRLYETALHWEHYALYADWPTRMWRM